MPHPSLETLECRNPVSIRLDPPVTINCKMPPLPECDRRVLHKRTRWDTATANQTPDVILKDNNHALKIVGELKATWITEHHFHPRPTNEDLFSEILDPRSWFCGHFPCQHHQCTHCSWFCGLYSHQCQHGCPSWFRGHHQPCHPDPTAVPAPVTAPGEWARFATDLTNCQEGRPKSRRPAKLAALLLEDCPACFRSPRPARRW